MLKIDEDVFGDMVKFYGNVFHLPPLASKIYSYLIFDFERTGISFDEFVEIFSASKSSVSSNLNLLLNLKIITDFTKIDERRRFFVMNEKYMKIRLEEIINKMEEELKILNKLKNLHPGNGDVGVKKFEIYQKLFENNILNIQETLDQL